MRPIFNNGVVLYSFIFTCIIYIGLFEVIPQHCCILDSDCSIPSQGCALLFNNGTNPTLKDNFKFSNLDPVSDHLRSKGLTQTAHVLCVSIENTATLPCQTGCNVILWGNNGLSMYTLNVLYVLIKC